MLYVLLNDAIKVKVKQKLINKVTRKTGARVLIIFYSIIVSLNSFNINIDFSEFLWDKSFETKKHHA